MIEFSGELLFAEKEVPPRPFKKNGLNTLLLHVRAFKTRNYARATEELAGQEIVLLKNVTGRDEDDIGS